MFYLDIPQPVEKIIGILNGGGFEAYAVGGCVRDALMGREPEDWDITTSARPEDVKALFRRTVDTGIKHGTVTVLMKGKGYEVTTYRIDGAYADNRHPEKVTFTSDLLEDLRRRDFTVNAMAYSPKDGLVDEFGGVEDIERKIIRCVGDPMERFDEDALRILRAIRFSAQLNFSTDTDTYEAIGIAAPNIAGISKERIQAELTKLLLSGRPMKIREVFRTHISDYISPAFARIDWKNCDISPALPAVKYVRWAAFLRPANQPVHQEILNADQNRRETSLKNPEESSEELTEELTEQQAEAAAKNAEQVLRDLKFDNDTLSSVKILTEWSGRKIDEDAVSVRQAMSRMKPELWDALIILNGYSERVKELTDEIRRNNDCLSLKNLAVTGQDLKSAGIKPGKEMGAILDGMLQDVLIDPSHNNKEYLMGELGKFTGDFSKSDSLKF